VGLDMNYQATSDACCWRREQS